MQRLAHVLTTDRPLLVSLLRALAEMESAASAPRVSHHSIALHDCADKLEGKVSPFPNRRLTLPTNLSRFLSSPAYDNDGHIYVTLGEQEYDVETLKASIVLNAWTRCLGGLVTKSAFTR